MLVRKTTISAAKPFVGLRARHALDAEGSDARSDRVGRFDSGMLRDAIDAHTMQQHNTPRDGRQQ